MIKVLSEVETPSISHKGIKKSVILNINATKAKIYFEMTNGTTRLQAYIFDGFKFNLVLTISEIIPEHNIDDMGISYVSDYIKQQRKANEYIERTKTKLVILIE